MMEDYKDFDFDNSPSVTAVPRATCSAEHDEQLSGLLQPRLQSRFFDQVEFVPPEMGARISKLRELWTMMESKINIGNGDTYKRAYARLLQLINELDGVINSETGEGHTDIRRPQTKAEKKKVNNLTNKSLLCYLKAKKSKSSNSKKGNDSNKKYQQKEENSSIYRKHLSMHIL